MLVDSIGCAHGAHGFISLGMVTAAAGRLNSRLTDENEVEVAVIPSDAIMIGAPCGSSVRATSGLEVKQLGAVHGPQVVKDMRRVALEGGG